MCSHHRDDNNDWRERTDKKRERSENEWKKMNRKGKEEEEERDSKRQKKEENRRESRKKSTINDIIICDSPVYKSRTTLLHIPITSPHSSKHCIAELLKGKVHTHFRYSCSYEQCVSPPLTEVKQYIALNTVEICSGIIFDFCTKLSCQLDQQ